jgi:hypothetical protein
LHTPDAEALDFLQRAPQRQTKRFQTDADFRTIHG